MTTELLRAQTATAQEAARLLVDDLDQWGIPGYPVALVRTPTGPRPALVLAPQDVVDPATYGVVWAATPEPDPLRRIEAFHEGLWPFQMVPWLLAHLEEDGSVYRAIREAVGTSDWPAQRPREEVVCVLYTAAACDVGQFRRFFATADTIPPPWRQILQKTAVRVHGHVAKTLMDPLMIELAILPRVQAVWPDPQLADLLRGPARGK